MYLKVFKGIFLGVMVVLVVGVAIWVGVGYGMTIKDPFY